MGQIGNDSAISSYAADYQYRTEQAKTNRSEKTENSGKKSRVSGRTIGNPELSEKAQKYYEQLKAKYSNMDFILVSPDKKEEAEQNKGMYASSKELLVLIDSDKIEKMAEDEEYRAKYEAILSGATAQLSQMKESLGTNADRVSSFGMTFDDHGNASFFAVVDKSLAMQRERIEEKRAKAREEKKEAAKKAAEKRKEEAAKETAQTGKHAGVKETHKPDYVTVTAPSWEELLKKIDNVIFSERADNMRTDAEKAVGGNFDYSV